MRALGKLQKQISGKYRSKTGRKELCQSNRPKNGLLVLGVLMTVAVMVGLTIFNLKLIREQTAIGKQSVEQSNSKSVVTVVPTQTPGVDAKPEEKTLRAATEVTFYKQLKSEDENKNLNDTITQKPKPTETQSKPPSHDEAQQIANKVKEETDFSAPALSGKTCPPSSEPTITSPKPIGGTKVYSVQIGVFSYPRVAQEWAQKWRSKGYPVALRPIARPKAGIQYRLFVGEFNSEKKADEFAKQLKAKEGVSGLTLVIKN